MAPVRAHAADRPPAGTKTTPPPRFTLAVGLGHVWTMPVDAAVFGMSGAQIGVPAEARREPLVAVPDSHGRINTPRFGFCAQF